MSAALSEGVDVPSLDAVLFLSRAILKLTWCNPSGGSCRRAPGKKYGYIIIPVVIPSDVPPDEALDDNERFKVVWSVLNALRAHDDRFNAMVNKIELNKKTRPDKVIVAPPGSAGGEGTATSQPRLGSWSSRTFRVCRMRFMPGWWEKVGSRRYWEQWASDVADIAKRHIERITKTGRAVARAPPGLCRLPGWITQKHQPSVTEDEAIEMLAQHIITKASL